MKNEPNIRIKGFEGEWKECTFNNLVDRISSYSSSKSLPTVEFEDIISGENRLNKDVYSKPIHKGGIAFEKNDVLFGKLRPYLKNILFATFNGIAVGDFWVLRANESYPAFVYTLVNNKSFMDVANISSGSKMPRADWNLVSKHKFLVPSFFEQRAIATYFRHLDSLIEIADKKVASLKQVKEASLQSMFPKERQKVPEVRFKGFEGEWKVCQGEDLFETYNERNRPDLPVLSAFQDIRGMAVRSDSGYEISHNKRNEVTYKVVKPGQFVMHLRSFQGGFAHSSIEGITSPAYTVFGFKESNANNDYYWKTIFMSKEFIDRLKTITYGIRDGRSISFPEFLKMKFRVPSIDEQRKIASFFVHLDKQIAIAQQRLDLLRRIKSACLDGMFV